MQRVFDVIPEFAHGGSVSLPDCLTTEGSLAGSCFV